MTERTQNEPMLEVEEAQKMVLASIRTLETERVGLEEAAGRVLREDVRASHDVPQRDNSAMDGYAVRTSDILDAGTGSPKRLAVLEDRPAGKVTDRYVTPGTAIRIMTGALIPAGADAVVPVELTDGGTEWVNILRSVPPKSNIRSRGEDMKAGDVVLQAGRRITAAEAGVLATAGKQSVLVGQRPTVSIFATGDELTEPWEELGSGGVVNSNSYSLAALVREAGGVPRMMGIVKDDRDATIAAIESALQSDFAISTGGVSVGAWDFVKDALAALGAETRFWRVAMKPGKPVVFSTLHDNFHFGLPGNPVSCVVAFLLFVAPALRKAEGQEHDLFPPAVKVRLLAELRSKGDRRTYQRVKVSSRGGELFAMPMRAQGSGISTSMTGANGLAILEKGTTSVAAGESVMTLLIGAIGTD